MPSTWGLSLGIHNHPNFKKNCFHWINFFFIQPHHFVAVKLSMNPPKKKKLLLLWNKRNCFIIILKIIFQILKNKNIAPGPHPRPQKNNQKTSTWACLEFLDFVYGNPLWQQDTCKGWDWCIKHEGLSGAFH
jgi:hypothetical protein